MKNNTMRVLLVAAGILFTGKVSCLLLESSSDVLQRLIQKEDSWAAAQNVAAYLNKLSDAEAERSLNLIVPLIIRKFNIKQLGDQIKVMFYLAAANAKAAKQWLINHMTEILSESNFPALLNFYGQQSADYDPHFLRTLLTHRDDQGRTVLIEAVQELHRHPSRRANILPLISRMIAQGADVNAQDNSGYTALMYAAELSDLGVAEALLTQGADPRITGIQISAAPSAESAALAYGPKSISAITLARGNPKMEELFAKHLGKPLAEIFTFHGGRKEKNY